MHLYTEYNFCEQCGEHRVYHTDRYRCPPRKDEVMVITPKDKTADFVASETVLETKRKVVFQQGRDLNLRDVVEVNLDGSWWRIKTADGKLHLVDPSKVNYATIA